MPTALPMVGTYAHLVRTRPRATRRVLFFVLGYLMARAGFGLIAYAADLLVHRAVRESAFLARHTSLLGGGVLVPAGLYQLTPLKRRCLRQCRSALSFLMAHWREGRRGAWQMGAHHGIFCVGCCWALMLVMFGLGMLQLAWMLGLALLMFVEKTVRGGEGIGQLTTPLLVLLGLLALTGAGAWS
jgi:predicted metal-binding membrane protein